jgi:hypothetical protein
MASTKVLNAEDRDATVGMIAARGNLFQPTDFPYHSLRPQWAAEMGNPLLRESYEVFTTSADDLAKAAASGLPLASACRPTGMWHHQLAFGERVALFARTTFVSSDEGGNRLEVIMAGILAPRLEAARAFLDREFRDDFVVTFVEVPEFVLYVLILAKGQDERILVVSTPFGFDELGEKLLTVGAFLELLEKLPRPNGIDSRDAGLKT